MPAAIPDDEVIWSRILDEVQSRAAGNLPQGSVLILGDNDSGKTTLVARLQRNDDPKKGTGLEYHYLDVNPDYRDGSYAYQLGSALPDVGPGESTRLGVWILDGDPVYSPLIKFALQPEQLDRSVVLLCASMAEPWSLLDSLQRWVRILQEHLNVSSAYDKNVLKEARDRQIRFWQEYVEPLDSSSHSDLGAKVPSMETDHFLLPLGENTLTNNTGLPIIVVITKCDSMSTLEKEFDFKEEQFDFIQQHVRKFCLSIGAALVYTSVKEGRNCDVLYSYVLNRVYGFPFTRPALVVEKDAVFIPTGWDNEKKISILYENLSSIKPNDAYEDHIKKPLLRRPIPKDVEIQAEDEQNFLSRMQSILNTQTPPPSSAQPTPPSTRPTEPSSPLLQPRSLNNKSASGSASPASPQVAPGQVKKPGSKQAPGGQTTQEGVLAQFFNNLLQKKGGGATGDKQFPTNETAAAAAAELESSYGKIPDRPQNANTNHVAVNDSAAESA